jgi:hypothetical protein
MKISLQYPQQSSSRIGAIAIALAFAICAGAAGSAFADHDDYEGGHWRGGHHRHYHERWERSGPRVYYAPRPSYYYSRRRYYSEPPPVVYYPRQPSGLNFFFGR